MKLVLLLLFSLAVFVSADEFAVLVAGSNTYGNYRHQADVCHAYQILIKHGYNPDNIIVMAYDDIANDPENPFPGKVFNKPSDGPGTDVYAGCKINYKGEDVNPDNYIAII
jgi:legumain